MQIKHRQIWVCIVCSWTPHVSIYGTLKALMHSWETGGKNVRLEDVHISQAINSDEISRLHQSAGISVV